MKLRKAEAHEKKNYDGLYPLFGYAVGVPAVICGIKTRFTVPVEYLGEGKDQPNYEAILPKGMHLAGDYIHTVLGVTQRDLLDRLSYGMELCNSACGGERESVCPTCSHDNKADEHCGGPWHHQEDDNA